MNHTKTIEVTEKQYATLLNALKSLREEFCCESAETFNCEACLIGQYGECIADKIETTLGGIKKVYTAEIEVQNNPT